MEKQKSVPCHSGDVEGLALKRHRTAQVAVAVMEVKFVEQAESYISALFIKSVSMGKTDVKLGFVSYIPLFD